MKTRWYMVIESLGSWWIDCEGKALGPHATKDEAAARAKEAAAMNDDMSRRSDVWIPDENGRMQLVWSGVPTQAAAQERGKLAHGG